MSRRKRRTALVELNLTPLIDLIFILIIFFMVTGTFVRESGIDVRRPEASTARTMNPDVTVSIDAAGVVWIERQSVDVRSVRYWMIRFLAESPEGSVVIAADFRARHGVVVQVMDACRAAGVKNVSIAAAVP